MKAKVYLGVSPYGDTETIAVLWLRKNHTIYSLALVPDMATEAADLLNSLPHDQGIYPGKGGWYCYDGFVEDGPHEDITAALKALKMQIMLAKKAQAERQ